MKDSTAPYRPVETLGADRKGPWLITCDHASNTVPATVSGGDLGIAPADMARHIAFDIGAAGVSKRLGELLDAPVVLSNFSRLVIDPNRGEDDPTLLMQLYDGTVIEGNRRMDAAEREHRLNLCYRPYHAELTRHQAQASPEAIYVAIHSFTPQLNARAPRPWHISVLYSERDARFSQDLLGCLRRNADLCIGDNEPYHGELAGDSVERHALDHGRQNTLIEIRNDLIATEAGQMEWAERLAPILEEARKATQF